MENEEYKSRMVRIRVADDVWEDFRHATRNRYLSNALGELVSDEVKRIRAQNPELSEEQVEAALEDARGLVERLERLCARLERVRG